MARNGNGGSYYRYRAYRRRKRDGDGIPRWLMALGLLGALFAIGAGAMAAVGYGVYQSYANDLVPPDEAIAQLPQGGALILDRNGTPLYRFLDENSGLRDPVPTDQISLWVSLATIATEDATFMDNPGVNAEGLTRAAWENFSPFGSTPGFLEGSGGSSITQQLVKNVYFSPEERSKRSVSRKMKETIYALELTKRYTKPEIMGWYLNQISYGNVFIGIGAASKGYFNKAPADLTLAEAATLAGIPASPTGYDPFSKPDATLNRRNYVLRRIHQEGYITSARLWEAATQPLGLNPAPAFIDAPHFVFNVVKPELDHLFGEESVKQDGLIVTTSLDLELQHKSEETLEKWIEQYEASGGHNGAVVAIDPKTAEVLTYIGSRNYFDESIQGQNDMADALNSPGSSFKPFTYLTAFMKLGWGPGTLILDTPLNPKFWDGKNQPRDPIASLNGPMPAREALGNSMNLPAVKTILSAGVPNVIDQAKKMGITSLDDRQLGPSMTIGGVDVKLADMVYGYSVFPNLGVLKGVPTSQDLPPGNRSLDPVTILKVTDSKGNILYPLVDGQPVQSPPIQEERVAPAEESYLINNILSDPSAHCRTYGCGYLTIPGRPIAAKTGTSEPYEDSRAIGDTWVIGYTPQLVVGTWFGNADNSPMHNISSANVTWLTVRDIQTEYLKDLPVEQFTRPEGIVEYATCIVSNLKPTSSCPKTNNKDLLAAHSVPTADDTWWKSVSIDSRTGKLPSEFTPPRYITTSHYLQLPAGISDFARDQAIEWTRFAGGAVGTAPTERTTEDDIPGAITSPANGTQVEGLVLVTGRAVSSNFQSYRLEYQLTGAGDWITIGESDNQVPDGRLGFFDTTDLEPGPYTLRLVIIDASRGEISVSIVVQVTGNSEEEPGNGGGGQGQGRRGRNGG